MHLLIPHEPWFNEPGTYCETDKNNERVKACNLLVEMGTLQREYLLWCLVNTLPKNMKSPKIYLRLVSYTLCLSYSIN